MLFLSIRIQHVLLLLLAYHSGHAESLGSEVDHKAEESRAGYIINIYKPATTTQNATVTFTKATTAASPTTVKPPDRAIPPPSEKLTTNVTPKHVGNAVNWPPGRQHIQSIPPQYFNGKPVYPKQYLPYNAPYKNTKVIPLANGVRPPPPPGYPQHYQYPNKTPQKQVYNQPPQRPPQYVYSNTTGKPIPVQAPLYPKFTPLPQNVQVINGVRYNEVKPPRPFQKSNSTPIFVSSTTTTTTTERPKRIKRIWPKHVVDKMNDIVLKNYAIDNSSISNDTISNSIDNDIAASNKHFRYTDISRTSSTTVPPVTTTKIYRRVTRKPKVSSTTVVNFASEKNDWVPIMPSHYSLTRKIQKRSIAEASSTQKPVENANVTMEKRSDSYGMSKLANEQNRAEDRKTLYLHSFRLVPIRQVGVPINIRDDFGEKTHKKLNHNVYSGYRTIVRRPLDEDESSDLVTAASTVNKNKKPQVITKVKHHHHHHHHKYVKTVEKPIKVPVKVEVPRPVPFPVKVPVPVEKVVEKVVEKKVPYPVPVEKKVPYPVAVKVPQPYPVKTVQTQYVPRPYPVQVPVYKQVEVKVPHPVPVQVEREVQVPIRVPVPVDRYVEVPVEVEKQVPYPVPVKIFVPQPYPVEKRVPYPVEVKVPEPVEVIKHVQVPVYVPKPYPVRVPEPVEVEKRVPYPVEVEKKVPVPYKVFVPHPVPVEKKVPVYINRPYPVEKKVYVPHPVPVPMTPQQYARRRHSATVPPPQAVVTAGLTVDGYDNGSTTVPNNSESVQGNGQFIGFADRVDVNCTDSTPVVSSTNSS